MRLTFTWGDRCWNLCAAIGFAVLLLAGTASASDEDIQLRMLEGPSRTFFLIHSDGTFVIDDHLTPTEATDAINQTLDVLSRGCNDWANLLAINNALIISAVGYKCIVAYTATGETRELLCVQGSNAQRYIAPDLSPAEAKEVLTQLVTALLHNDCKEIS